MRFSKLSNDLLLKSYLEAINKKFTLDFIEILQKEIVERGLPLPAYENTVTKKNILEPLFC